MMVSYMGSLVCTLAFTGQSHPTLPYPAGYIAFNHLLSRVLIYTYSFQRHCVMMRDITWRKPCYLLILRCPKLRLTPKALKIVSKGFSKNQGIITTSYPLATRFEIGIQKRSHFLTLFYFPPGSIITKGHPDLSALITHFIVFHRTRDKWICEEKWNWIFLLPLIT